MLSYVCRRSALTAVQTGHLGHVPVPDGLVEVVGASECCSVGEIFEPTSPRTNEINGRRSEHIGNTEKDTEDDSAAEPAIEAACESLLVEERRTRNKEQNTRACAVAALAVLCVGGIRTHCSTNWSPWPRPSPRWAG